jgi:hypothetical protein
MRKVFLILIFLTLLRCTVTIIAVKQSTGTSIDTEGGHDISSDLEAELQKNPDSIKP